MPPASLKTTAGADKLKTYEITPKFHKQFCSECGTGVWQYPASKPFIAIFPSLLETNSVKAPKLAAAMKPQMHVNCENSLVDIKDDLPRFKDFPKEIGGSGEMWNGPKE